MACAMRVRPLLVRPRSLGCAQIRCVSKSTARWATRSGGAICATAAIFELPRSALRHSRAAASRRLVRADHT